MGRRVTAQDHEPRFEMWSTNYPPGVDEIVFVQLGVQGADRAAVERQLELWVPLLNNSGHSPKILDRGHFVDNTGLHNALLLAYWFSPEGYEQWAALPEVGELWRSLPDDGDFGYWRETASITQDHMETIYTPHDPAAYDTPGIAQHVEIGPTPTHDYWGSSRDRIGAAAIDHLDGDLFEFTPTDTDTRGQRVSVEVPGNICIIRTAQDWRNSTVYREHFLNVVAPVKDAGVDYLGTHPASGCVAARKVYEQDESGNDIERTCTVGYFLSLEHLLVWGRAHNSHLEIYGAFMKMVNSGDTPLDVSLWHEVSVIPKGKATAEYVNCHNETGLLPILGSKLESGAVVEAAFA